MVKRSVTPRGFVVYDEFLDHDGDKIHVQQSSAIDFDRPGGFERPGSSYLRIYCKLPKPETASAWGDDTSMHLDVEQACRLRDAINAWLAEHDV